jgi:prevent-host-death family protein
MVTMKREQQRATEVSVRDARQHFADVLYRAAAGRITYITSRGRRIAAVVPLAMAEEAEDDGAPTG